MPEPKSTSSKHDGEVARLEAEARRAMGMAYNRYSQFGVGAALLTKEGLIFSGCNVENAAYGHSLCAERVALVKAVSEGHRELASIVIVCSSGKPVAPCGACRQTLWEFAPDLEVVMAGERHRVTVSLRELLPRAFGPNDLPTELEP